jgi:imidazolonepropionase-like amidohydrolase
LENLISVEDGRISAVASERPAVIDVIDLSTQTGLPGLIDLHVRLSDQLSSRSCIHRYTWSAADDPYGSARNARERAVTYDVTTTITRITT